jgi:hypothetical protein
MLAVRLNREVTRCAVEPSFLPRDRHGTARRCADLVVWWQKGAYAQEDEALREIIAAFEQGGGTGSS